MKKLLSNLFAGALAIGAAQAAVVLNEPFTYADGSLTTVSAGVWANHSGTAGQLDVASGKANLSQTEAEDVNAPLAGSPYSSGTLYASFVVNFSTLPLNGAGSYFAHFKDDTTVNFKARVFATISGAAPGQFRVGIANGGNTPVVIARDLSLAQDYTLVVRYDTGTGASTLWISPASESSTTDRSDGTDTTGAVGIIAFALRQSNANGGMGILTLDDLKVGTAFGDVVGGGDPNLNPPSIGNIPNQSIAANAATADIPFTVADGETPAGSLVVTAGSDNPGLVPAENVVFGGSGADRTVKVTPVASQQGVAVISVTVTDGNNNTATRTFRIVVGAPTISAIANQAIARDTFSPPIPFTVADAESDSLTVSAVSTNEALVPIGNISIGGLGNNRTVTFLPTPGSVGLTRITLIVSDGFNSASNSFIVNVFGVRGVDFADSFDYPDGSVTTNSFFTWATHSAGNGQTGQTQVVSGKLHLSSTQGEDINAFLTNSPYAPSEGWILYSSFTVNFTGRPSNAGDYFAHFRNTGNSFGARVFATISGAASDKLRLGIANNATAPNAVFPLELDTNVTYTVVTRLNVGTGQSTLWVNPASETDASVTATDNAFPFDVWTFAFRQSGGIGTLSVDDLKIGTAFSDVLEARYRLQIQKTGGGVQISWLKAAQTAGYRLQGNTDLNSSGWTDVTTAAVEQGDNLVVTLNGITGNRFFRLIK